MTNEIHPKLIRARAALITSQPFFGTLALHLTPQEVADSNPMWRGGRPTMATDGTSLFYSRAFIDATAPAELLGVCAHEVMHPALGHHARRGTRDPGEWNKAADYALNPILIKSGFVLPHGVLIDARFDGLSAEEIYAIRARESQAQKKQGNGGNGAGPGQPSQGGAPQPGNGQAQQGGQPGGPGQSPGQPGKGGAGQPGAGPGAAGIDPGGCGAVLDAAPEHDKAAQEAAAAEWQARLRQALSVAKAHGAGKLPGGLESIVEIIGAPIVDWRAELARFIDNSQSRDYSWMRANRRHVAAGRYLPGFVPDRPSHIVAMIDSSGSMSDDELAAFACEIQAMLDEGAADRVTVAFADTKVHKAETFAAGDVLARMKVSGRGGTNFRAPFEWIAENVSDASAVVYMTDLDTSDFGECPAAPVLWIVTGDAKRARVKADRVPFGESVLLAA